VDIHQTKVLSEFGHCQVYRGSNPIGGRFPLLGLRLLLLLLLLLSGRD